MATATFKHPADEYHFTAGADYAAGDVILVGNEVGIIEGNSGVKSGDAAVARMQGVYEITMLSTDTGSVGALVYWDAGNTRLTTTAGSLKSAGVLRRAKASGETTALVSINEGVATVTI